MTVLTLAVDAVTKDKIECTVQEPCTLPGGADMTMHGAAVHSKLPILRDSDKAALTELCELGVHYVCLSYCRSAADVATVRRFLDECAAESVIFSDHSTLLSLCFWASAALRGRERRGPSADPCFFLRSAS